MVQFSWKLCLFGGLLILVVVSIIFFQPANFFDNNKQSVQRISSGNGIENTTIVQSVRVDNNVNRKDLYFAMCLISKNDHLDIVEWIEYHRRLGCSKFYLFDHNSTVPMLDTIRHYVSDGLVEYFFSDFKKIARPQMHVYQNCITQYGHKHQFIAFVDSDEFIVVTNKSASIPSILKNYEQYGGLTLNWKLFGSNGHVKRPTGGILSNYNKCGDNVHVKTIVNTEYPARAGGNPHGFAYTPPYFAVDTSHKRNDLPWNPNVTGPVPSYVYDIMYINHYNLKSVEDYKHKVAKGKADNSPASIDQLFDLLESSANKNCSFLEMPPPSPQLSSVHNVVVNNTRLSLRMRR